LYEDLIECLAHKLIDYGFTGDKCINIIGVELRIVVRIGAKMAFA
jgi:hypothetical protein